MPLALRHDEGSPSARPPSIVIKDRRQGIEENAFFRCPRCRRRKTERRSTDAAGHSVAGDPLQERLQFSVAAGDLVSGISATRDSRRAGRDGGSLRHVFPGIVRNQISGAQIDDAARCVQETRDRYLQRFTVTACRRSTRASRSTAATVLALAIFFGLVLSFAQALAETLRATARARS